MTKRKQSYRRGDAMTVVLVVLVVVLIGVLGFIAWQNFGGNNADNTTTDSTQQQPAEQDEEAVLAFSKWNVEAPLGSAAAKYSVFESAVAEDGTVETYGITLDGMDGFDGCAPSGQSGPGPIGTLTVVDQAYADTMGTTYEPVVTIDDVEYGYLAEAEPEACATDAADKATITAAAQDFQVRIAGLRKAE